MKFKRQFLNFGFSSILMGFCMMCMLTFATLALVTANSDYQLSKKVAEKNTNYYEVQNEAYQDIAKIDSMLMKVYSNNKNRDMYLQKAYNKLYASELGDATIIDNELYFHFSKYISENQTLEISLKILYPDNNKSGFYQVVQWQTTTNTDIDTEEPLKLIGNN